MSRPVRQERSQSAIAAITEELDGGGLSWVETARALADLRRANTWLLGYRPTWQTLSERLRSGPRRQSLLDVGCALGDVSVLLCRRAMRAGVELRTFGVDRHLRHLLCARQVGGSPAVVADAEQLPFRSGAVDWTLCTLLFHHFEDAGKRRLLGEMRRVARCQAIVVDLARSRWSRLLVRLLLPLLGLGRVARRDGCLSVDRSSTVAEVAALLADQPIAELRGRFPCRYSLVLTSDSAALGDRPVG